MVNLHFRSMNLSPSELAKLVELKAPKSTMTDTSCLSMVQEVETSSAADDEVMIMLSRFGRNFGS